MVIFNSFFYVDQRVSRWNMLESAKEKAWPAAISLPRWCPVAKAGSPGPMVNIQYIYINYNILYQYTVNQLNIVTIKYIDYTDIQYTVNQLNINYISISVYYICISIVYGSINCKPTSDELGCKVLPLTSKNPPADLPELQEAALKVLPWTQIHIFGKPNWDIPKTKFGWW